MHVISKEYYTLDATAGTVTLSTPYSDLNFEQFVSIVDLDTNDVIYDVHLKRDGVTYSGGIITYTADNNITNDTDTIRIVVEDSAALTEALGGYDRTLDSLKMVEQAPLDQQPLDPNPVLNAVTTAQTSTYTTVLDKQRLTVIVNVTSGATGGTITLKTKNSAGTAISVPFVDTTDDSINASKVCTTGSYIFKLPADITIKDLAVDLSSVTDGTFTVDILGGAL